MRGSKLGLLAIGALVVGVAGCSLPEVLPIASGTTQGPSPYGPWYEQHWATNAVLLAAADQPEADTNVEAPADAAAAQDDAAANADPGTPVLKNAVVQSGQPAAVESTVSTSQRSVDFDNSTPYQFPSNSFAPVPAAAPAPSDDARPAPVPSSPEKKVAPAGGGPIRY